MTIDEIRAKASRQGAGGLDARTIVVDIEVQLGRALEPAEAQAVQDGWRASAKERQKRAQARDAATAAAVRGR